MKKACLAILLAASLLLLSACSWNLTEGTCVDKRHTEAYTTRWLQMLRCGKTSIPIWRTTTHPATWKLQVAGPNEEGQIVTEWWSVTQTVYDATDIGDFVTRAN